MSSLSTDRHSCWKEASRPHRDFPRGRVWRAGRVMVC